MTNYKIRQIMVYEKCKKSKIATTNNKKFNMHNMICHNIFYPLCRLDAFFKMIYRDNVINMFFHLHFIIY